MTSKIRTFTELNKLKTFIERYNYLRLVGTIGETTFGFDRYLNQILYTSRSWLRARDSVIIRDNGCDLGIPGYEVANRLVIHHMNPLKIDDIKLGKSDIYDPEFLICTSYNTHLAIHYGNESLLPEIPIERHPNDTIPWR